MHTFGGYLNAHIQVCLHTNTLHMRWRQAIHILHFRLYMCSWMLLFMDHRLHLIILESEQQHSKAYTEARKFLPFGFSIHFLNIGVEFRYAT